MSGGVATGRASSDGERSVGTYVGRYVLRGVLGSGASAIVYDAEHRATGRRVALKTLHADLVNNELIRLRFRREMRVLGALRAPNLVDAIDGGTDDDGSPYLVLERLNGPTLATMLDRGPLALAAAIEVMSSVLEALTVLHAEGIVHRDLKPENIVLHESPTGRVVKLLDLGVCAFVEDLDNAPRVGRQGRLTGDGHWIGTPCYMSPEQVEGGRVDARTDVYGAGVVLYECLTGRTPFEAKSTLDVVTAVQHRPVMPPAVVRPSCPRELDTLVLRALTRDAEGRPPSAAEFSRTLAAIARKHDLPTGARALALLPDGAVPPIELTQIMAKDRVAATLRESGASPQKIVRAPSLDPYRLPKRPWPRMRSVLLGASVVAAVIALTAYTTVPAPRRPVVFARSPRAITHSPVDVPQADAGIALVLEVDPPLAPEHVVPVQTALTTVVRPSRSSRPRADAAREPSPQLVPADEHSTLLAWPPTESAGRELVPEAPTTPAAPIVQENPFGPIDPPPAPAAQPGIPANPFLADSP